LQGSLVIGFSFYGLQVHCRLFAKS
jgi:hypothetical protein